MEPKEASPPAPPEQESVNQEEPRPKSKKTVILIIAGVIILLILIVPALLFFLPFNLFGLFGLFDRGGLSGPSGGVLSGKDPDSISDPSQTVSQNIQADKGGTIQGVTGGGNTVTITIPPGSLKKDTNIPITPLKESPVNGYPNMSDPGVVIGPSNTAFNPPASVTFNSGPPANPPGSQSSGSQPGGSQPGGSQPPGGSGEAPDEQPPAADDGTAMPYVDPASLMAGLNTGNIYPGYQPGSQTGTTPGQGGADSRQDTYDAGVIIYTDSHGNVQTIPSSRSSSGGTTGAIGGTGTTSTDDPDKEEAEKITDNAASNAGGGGGSCTPEFLQAAAAMMQQAESEAEMNSYARLIEDCLNLDYLRQLCANDRVKLRRVYFTQRIALAQSLDPQIAAELQRLMQECTAQYHISASGSPPVQGGNMISSSIDTSVCGYIDDEWSGNLGYQLVADADTSHVYEGQVKFTIPPGGGEFGGTADGSHSMQVVGVPVAIPNFPLGFTGTFDGSDKVNLWLYPSVEISNVPIVKETDHCVDESNLPPLEPLTPRGGDQNLPPLEPLVPPSESEGEIPLVPLVPESE